MSQFGYLSGHSHCVHQNVEHQLGPDQSWCDAPQSLTSLVIINSHAPPPSTHRFQATFIFTMTFGEVILARKAVKAYASTPIPEKTLAEILRLTQVRSLLVPVQ
jgi:hypothetical protein